MDVFQHITSTGPEFYAVPERGAHLRIVEESVSEVFGMPAAAEVLATRGSVIADLSLVLEDAKLSKAARAAVEKALEAFAPDYPEYLA